jgi:antitoxin MazE
MVTRVQRWGNSLGLRLPKAAAEEAGVREGAQVDVSVRDGEIVVKPLLAPRFRLRDLLKAVRSDNIHPEADWGGPKGRELL